MMFLTKSQFEKMCELQDAQFINRDKQITPTIEEVEKMKVLAPQMTLDKFLALPENERQKWMISADPRRPSRNLGFDEKLGEDVYFTTFYFEPWDPTENRIY